MTRNEESVFRGLTTPEFRGIHRAFWEIRDPDPATEENEFRTELETRFGFRQQIPARSQPPRMGHGSGHGVHGSGTALHHECRDDIVLAERFDSNSCPHSLVWPYGDSGIHVRFIDNQGYGVYELDMVSTSPRLMDLLERAKTQFIHGGPGAEDAALPGIRVAAIRAASRQAAHRHRGQGPAL